MGIREAGACRRQVAAPERQVVRCAARLAIRRQDDLWGGPCRTPSRFVPRNLPATGQFCGMATLNLVVPSGRRYTQRAEEEGRPQRRTTTLLRGPGSFGGGRSL